MPPTTPAPVGAPIWVDLMTSDPARSTALGGSIVVPAEDTPYGRLATATDPTGAHFKLVSPNPS